MFDDLKGIKEREIKRRERTALDDLLELNDKIVRGKIKIDLNKITKKVISGERKKLEEIVSRIEYDENDLISFVLSQCNKDYDKKIWELVGFYSGVLLSYLTEKNWKEGKRTIIKIDFGGNEFNNLFYYAECVDVVIVKNLIGNSALYGVASYGGKANQVIGIDIEGDDALGRVASFYRGKVDQVIGIDIKGRNALSEVASGGGVNQVIGVNIKGCMAFYRVGYRGKANQVIGVGISGDGALCEVASYRGRANQVIGIDIEGNNALGRVASEGGKVNQVIGACIKGNFALYGVGSYEEVNQVIKVDIKGNGVLYGMANQVIMYNVVGKYVLKHSRLIGELIKGRKAKRLLKQYGINDIIAIAESMRDDKDWKVMIDKANKIYSIYERIAKEKGWKDLVRG